MAEPTESQTDSAKRGSGAQTQAKVADDAAPQETTENQTASGPEPVVQDDEPTYVKEEWIERARTVFKVSPHAMAGALYAQDPTVPLQQSVVRTMLDRFAVREGK
jgi:hypothetical protein